MVLTRSYKHEDLREESTMNTMLRWSPTRQFHFHPDVNDLSERFFGGATDETAQRASWLPAAEGRMEDGTYVIQLALPGVDPQDVKVSLMDHVLTVTGQPKAGPVSTGTCPGLGLRSSPLRGDRHATHRGQRHNDAQRAASTAARRSPRAVLWDRAVPKRSPLRRTQQVICSRFAPTPPQNT